MELNKKQVKALLDIIPNGVHEQAVLKTLYIDTYMGKTVAVATNGDVLVAIEASALASHVGKFMLRDELLKWYKLASTRSILTSVEIASLLVEDDMKYPNWQVLISNLTPQPSTTVDVNPSYLVKMEELAGESLRWTMHGDVKPYIASNEVGKYVVMPLKKK
jgi:hypothetical protein